MSTNHEVRYWTQTLDFTEQQLRSAVAAAGVEVKKIRTYVRLRWRSVGLLGSEGGRCKSVRFGRESACCRHEPRRRGYTLASSPTSTWPISLASAAPEAEDASARGRDRVAVEAHRDDPRQPSSAPSGRRRGGANPASGRCRQGISHPRAPAAFQSLGSGLSVRFGPL